MLRACSRPFLPCKRFLLSSPHLLLHSAGQKLCAGPLLKRRGRLNLGLSQREQGHPPRGERGRRGRGAGREQLCVDLQPEGRARGAWAFSLNRPHRALGEGRPRAGASRGGGRCWTDLAESLLEWGSAGRAGGLGEVSPQESPPSLLKDRRLPLRGVQCARLPSNTPWELLEEGFPAVWLSGASSPGCVRPRGAARLFPGGPGDAGLRREA